MTAAISVSELNEQIKNLLETTFVRVYVEGELSRITYHNSGHIYFTLKDSGSAISCVMFRGNATKLRFRLEEGLKVIIDGAISVYKPRGQYQINAFMIEPAGHGALALAYEQLKQKLSAQGYFDPSHKKPIPRLPKKIALVTSATGAALQDMQRVAAHRWPLAKLFVYDSIVQGDAAAPSIVRNIQAADAAGYDLVIIGRGGGSIEDLWAFNEESVADAVYRANTPIVSAVGHEIDWVITDFVADLRAPTPSAAMQMVLPDQHEMFQSIDGIMGQYEALLQQRLHHYADKVAHLKQSYERHSIEQKLRNKNEEIVQLRQRFDQSVGFALERSRRLLDPVAQNLERNMTSLMTMKQAALTGMLRNLEANNPELKSKKGFAQISRSGKVVELSSLQSGDTFEAMDASVKVSATVDKSEPIQPS
ncbi:MAG: exodeoxyribonuclease VII large subunit [Sulfurimonadaceae bacterium]|nr:exodeoxyribonuclease VII large subunit [Sulfurimonadaceae bacterium]